MKVRGLYTAIYRVPDVGRAKAWYTAAFGVTPYFDEPFYVGFNIAGHELGLDPAPGGDNGPGGVTAYWGVPDLDAAVRHFTQVGGTLAAVAGFGAAAILLPVLVALFGPRDAIPILAVVGLVSNASRVGFNRTEVRWPIVGWFALGGIPAALIGGFLFAAAPIEALTRLIGAFLLASVAWRHLRPRPSGARPSTRHDSFSVSPMSGSAYRRTRGATTVPVMATPTRTSTFGRSARMSSRGSSGGPLKLTMPRSISSFWP